MPSALAEQLAILARRKAQLLNEEARLWSALGELVMSVEAPAVSPTVPPPSQSNSPDPERLFTVRDAASLMGLSPSTLNKWRLTGDGPHFVRLGSRVFYRRDELNKFISGKTFPDTSAYPPKPPGTRPRGG